jgi:hypothetical protein
MLSGHLAPFKAIELWRHALAMVEQHKWGIARDCNGDMYALRKREGFPGEKASAVADALAIRQACSPLLTLLEAADAVAETIKPPPEDELRLMIGAMLSAFRAKPNEGAPIYIDTLIWLLQEPEPG